MLCGARGCVRCCIVVGFVVGCCFVSRCMVFGGRIGFGSIFGSCFVGCMGPFGNVGLVMVPFVFCCLNSLLGFGGMVCCRSLRYSVVGSFCCFGLV